MHELIRVLSGSYLWLLVFFLLASAINKRSRRPLISGFGIITAYPLFCAFQILLAKGLDWTGVLNPKAAVIVFMATAVGLALYLFKIKKESPEASVLSSDIQDPFSRAFAFTAAGFILVALIPVSLFMPVYFFDDNVYHMPMVATYFQSGSLADWPTQSLRQIARPNAVEIQMLHLALLTNSDAWMQIPNLLALFVGLIVTFHLAFLVLNRADLSLICALLVLTARQTVLAPTTATNDASFFTLIVSLAYWLIYAVQRRPARSYVIYGFIGLHGALALSTKVPGASVFLALTLLMLIMTFMKRIALPLLLVFLGSSIFCSGLLMGDVFWENYLTLGNPFGLVPSEDHPLGTVDYFAVPGLYLYDLCFYRLFHGPNLSYGATHYGFVFPFILALGIIRVSQQILRSMNISNIALWTLSTLFILIFAFVVLPRTPQIYDLRFMTWMIPFAGILSLSWITAWRLRIVRFILIGISLLAIFNSIYVIMFSSKGYYLAESVRYFIRNGSLMRYVDLFPEDTLKLPDERDQDSLGSYAALEYNAKESDRILYLGGSSSWMYPAWGRDFSRHVTAVSDSKDALAKARSLDFEFMIIESDANALLRDNVLKEMRTLPYSKIAESKRRAIYRRENR